ncbi:MAG: helix-turn-helix transcriptional regulator [Bacteroidota bacterium]
MNPYSLHKLPSDILQETAQQHRFLRRQLKLSQAELAERSGVSLGSLKRFERTGKISFESLLKLAHLLDRLSSFENLFPPKEDFSEIEKLFSDRTRE